MILIWMDAKKLGFRDLGLFRSQEPLRWAPAGAYLLSINLLKVWISNIAIIARWGGGVLPYMGYIGMCGAKEYGFFSRFGLK